MAVHGRQSGDEKTRAYGTHLLLQSKLNIIKLEETARQEVKEMFGAQSLPPNHALTRHVHRIVSRILEANHLGTLKTSTPPSQTWFGDPFPGHTDDPSSNPNARQWELIVVKDDTIVNAMASFGNDPYQYKAGNRC